MAFDLESYTSPQVELIKELDRAARARDLSLLAKPLHKDFYHVIHPRSLGKLPVNRDEWLATMAETVLSAPMQFERTFHSVVEAPGKVVLRVSFKLKGMFEDATDESIWIVGFASGEDGSLKIKEIEQFADSGNYLDVFQAVKASK